MYVLPPIFTQALNDVLQDVGQRLETRVEKTQAKYYGDIRWVNQDRLFPLTF